MCNNLNENIHSGIFAKGTQFGRQKMTATFQIKIITLAGQKIITCGRILVVILVINLITYARELLS